jgi:hypothetical protein
VQGRPAAKNRVFRGASPDSHVPHTHPPVPKTAVSGAPAQNTRTPEYHMSQNGILDFWPQDAISSDERGNCLTGYRLLLLELRTTRRMTRTSTDFANFRRFATDHRLPTTAFSTAESPSTQKKTGRGLAAVGCRGERSFARSPSHVSRKKRKKAKEGWPDDGRRGTGDRPTTDYRLPATVL